ncbi:hypothetical protein IJJ37_00870 [Candidatus Saccharibacteria bacterium]|nr:hypothetical protein [Candidatus Saccharibacteria bacterium]
MSKKTEMAAMEVAKEIEEKAAGVSMIPKETTPAESVKSGDTKAAKSEAAAPAESEPEKTVVISEKEYSATKALIAALTKAVSSSQSAFNELVEKFAKLGDATSSLGDEVGALRKTVDALNTQLDCLVDKPVLVYEVVFNDGTQLVTEDEVAIYATRRLPTKLVQRYAWKSDEGEYTFLDDAELIEHGLENP